MAGQGLGDGRVGPTLYRRLFHCHGKMSVVRLLDTFRFGVWPGFHENFHNYLVRLAHRYGKGNNKQGDEKLQKVKIAQIIFYFPFPLRKGHIHPFL